MKVLAGLVGALYPARSLAVEAVSQRLVRFGLNPADYPLRDLAESALGFAKMHAQLKGGWYRAYLLENCETVAWTAAAITFGERGWSANEIMRGAEGGSPDHVWQAMAKHAPQKFSLAVLARTQADSDKRFW
jgi:hypothetical protein